MKKELETTRARAILVENDRSIRALQRTIIKRALGKEVEIVETASYEEATEHVKKSIFHLMFVDVSRPSEGLTKLLNASRNRQRIPVLAFTTGRVERETMKLLVSDHVYAVFPKPFDPQDVIDGIVEAFEEHDRSADRIITPLLHGIVKQLHKKPN